MMPDAGKNPCHLVMHNRHMDWSAQQAKETYLTQIEDILRRDEPRVREAFGDAIVDVRDRKKLVLFYKSPARYCRRVQWEDNVWIPLKGKIKSLLKQLIK